MRDHTPAHVEREKLVYTREKITNICGEGISQESKSQQMSESGPLGFL